MGKTLDIHSCNVLSPSLLLRNYLKKCRKINSNALFFYRSKRILDLSKLFLTRPNCFGQEQMFWIWLKMWNSVVKSCFLSGPKHFGPVQSNLYASKRVLDLKKDKALDSLFFRILNFLTLYFSFFCPSNLSDDTVTITKLPNSSITAMPLQNWFKQFGGMSKESLSLTLS